MASNKKLNAEEQLLLKDIFHIKIYEDSLEKFNNELVFLPNFAKDLEYLPGSNVSLLKNNTLFDSLLMERLAIPNTNVFEYLFESYLRAKEEKTKSWNINNPSNQEFIDYSIQILQNFAHLFCSTPELFPEKVPEPKFDNISDPVLYTSARISELIQYGIEQEFVFGLISKFEPDQQEEIASQILSQILIDQSQRNLFDDRALINVSNIETLLPIDLFKRNFMKLKQFPWIPGPNNINLTKGVGSAMGNLMENASPLGILLKPSFLEPLHASPKDKERYDQLLQKIQIEFKRRMKKIELENALKKYQGAQNRYCAIITNIFRQLLKPTKETIDYKTEVMRWFSALIVGNLSRTKLGMRLEQQNRALQYNSSDALCLNVFDVMLEICAKFLDRSSPLLEKIDPSYYQFGWRFEYKETGMVNKPGVKVEETSATQAKGPNDYGTVTEFFFHALELCHFCFIPILQNFSETMQLIQRLTEQKNLMDRNHFNYKKLEDELDYREKLFLAYKTLLFDEKRIGLINDLYDTLTFLLLKWNGLNPEEINSPDLSRFKPKNFMKFIPEHWLTDLFEFHFTYIKFKEDYVKALSTRYKGGNNIVNNYITFMSVILCENEMISNPYSKAKIVELVSFFGYENRTIKELYNTNELAKRILTPVLLKFYIDIEFTGASHQFYAKYEYRHYACSIFKIIWKLDSYKEAYIKIAHSDLVERFTNMVMNDTTYCMDEGLDKLVKIIDFQSREASGQPLSNEEKRDLDRFEGTARSVFLQVKEGLDLMAEISAWAPKSFFFGDFRKRLAQMLNYFLVQLMSSKYMVLKANDKLNFKPSRLIRDIIQIYHDEDFCEEVTKDQRSYSFEEMSRAAKKARMDKVLNEGVIEQFEAFLARTEKISIQNMDISAKLGDIPDEFMCPISCDLMKEPVLLPTSNTVMEKSVIKQILLNDEHDPFNRFPLKFSEVKDLPELRRKIEDWVQRKLRGEILEEEKPKQVAESKEGKMEEEKEIEDENTYSDLFYQKKF